MLKPDELGCRDERMFVLSCGFVDGDSDWFESMLFSPIGEKTPPQNMNKVKSISFFFFFLFFLLLSMFTALAILEMPLIMPKQAG